MTNAEVDAELKDAVALLPGYSKLFTDRGYTYVGMQRVQGADLPDRMEFAFTNESTGMRIDLLYTPPLQTRKRSFVVMVSKGRNKSFTLGDYLTARHRDSVKYQLRDAANSGDLATSWRNYFDELSKLLSQDPDLADIVDGRRWDDIPIDWMGLK
jgi:hypothetical protein